MRMTDNNRGSGELHEKALSNWFSTEKMKVDFIGESITRVKLRNVSLLQIENTQWRSLKKRGLTFELLSVSKKHMSEVGSRAS